MYSFLKAFLVLRKLLSLSQFYAPMSISVFCIQVCFARFLQNLTLKDLGICQLNLSWFLLLFFCAVQQLTFAASGHICMTGIRTCRNHIDNSATQRIRAKVQDVLATLPYAMRRTWRIQYQFEDLAKIRPWVALLTYQHRSGRTHHLATGSFLNWWYNWITFCCYLIAKTYLLFLRWLRLYHYIISVNCFLFCCLTGSVFDLTKQPTVIVEFSFKLTWCS